MKSAIALMVSLVLIGCSSIPTSPEVEFSGRENDLLGRWESSDGEFYHFEVDRLDGSYLFKRSIDLDGLHQWWGPYLYNGEILSLRVEYYGPPEVEPYGVQPSIIQFRVEIIGDGVFTKEVGTDKVVFERKD